MAIWGRYCDHQPEKVDEGDSLYLLREYRMAFGREWKLWRGRLSDEPIEGAAVDLRETRR